MVIVMNMYMYTYHIKTLRHSMGPLYSHIQRLTVTFRKLLILTLKILSEITYMHVLSYFCTMSVLCSDGEGNITNSYLMSVTWCEFYLYKRKFLRTAIIHVRLNAFVSKGFKCLRMHGVNAHVLFEKKRCMQNKNNYVHVLWLHEWFSTCSINIVNIMVISDV